MEVFQMSREAKRIEGQIQVDNCAKSLLHIVPRHPVIVENVLNHWPHALEL